MMKIDVKNHCFVWKAVLPIAIIAVFGGCSRAGPDFKGVDKPQMPASWRSGDVDINATAEWWKIFDDDVLDSLVRMAYAQNLNIQSAGLRILQARTVLGVSEGLVYPQVQSLSGSAAWSYRKEQGFGSAGVNFDIGWEMDVWGKYARGIESSEATLYASVMSYQDIMVSVIAEVARNYIDYRTAEERSAYARRNITIQERVTQMTQIQFNSGNVSELDMQQARTQLYNTRATLPAIELSRIRARNALAVLLGTTPDKMERLLKQRGHQWNDNIQDYIRMQKHDIVQLREDNSSVDISLIPVAKFDPFTKINASLLLRRPDLKVAEFQAHAASARIGIETAALYPSFTLFGTIGYSTNDIAGGWVSAPKALGISAGPSFTWNIWQYDRIKNQIRLQDAVFEEKLVNYNNKVLQAVSEVSNAFYGYNLTEKQLVENEKALDATVRAFNLSATQYNNGLVSYQRLLSTVENLTRTQDRYAQIRGSLATNAVLLYKALGGGWQLAGNQRYVSEKRAESMSERTDWGNYLDDNASRFPEEMR